MPTDTIAAYNLIMEHEVTIEKIGNELGFQIPESIMKHFGLQNGDTLNCEIKNGKLFLTPQKRHEFQDMSFLNEFDEKEWTW